MIGNMKYLGKYPEMISRYLAPFVLVVLLFQCSPALSCTLWGAVGTSTVDAVTLVGKNRDWKPGQTHELRRVSSAGSYAFLGLFAIGGESPGLKAGINEKGLVVIMATAPDTGVPDAFVPDADNMSSHRILSDFATVEETLTKMDGSIKATFYMVADSKRIAVFEGTTGDETGVRVTQDGFIAQTNHYISPELKSLNKKGQSSSRKRYGRIMSLLASEKGQLQLDDFIRFSEDRNAGPDNSIFRTGGSPDSARTVATWVVSIPETGSPLLYIALQGSGGSSEAYSGKLDPAFWDARTASAER